MSCETLQLITKKSYVISSELFKIGYFGIGFKLF